jgi:hypothetical protein
LSWDIVDAMSVVKELMPSPEGTVAEVFVAGVDEELAEDAGGDEAEVVDVDDEQPAATMATAAATATQVNLGRTLNVPWLCERECHPPCPLLRRSIPDPFRHNATQIRRRGTPYNTRVLPG